MKRTNIYLGEEQAANLDRLAEQEGVSRAELIRQLLNRALTNADDNLGSDLNAIDNSFGMLRDIDLQVRRPDAREGLQLATLNVRHFPMFERLQPPFAAPPGQRPRL